MVSEDRNRVSGSLEVLFPFRQRKDDREEFTIIDIIVSFGQGEGLGEISSRMKVSGGVGLHKDCSCCKKRSIGHEGKGVRNIWDAEDRSRGKDSF